MNKLPPFQAKPIEAEMAEIPENIILMIILIGRSIITSSIWSVKSQSLIYCILRTAAERSSLKQLMRSLGVKSTVIQQRFSTGQIPQSFNVFNFSKIYLFVHTFSNDSEQLQSSRPA